MIVLLLNEYDPASKAFTEAVAATGLTPDETVNVYTEKPWLINEWWISSLPCLLKVHDGRAVDQITDPAWLAGKKAATIKGRFTNAVKLYDEVKEARSARPT